MQSMFVSRYVRKGSCFYILSNERMMFYWGAIHQVDVPLEVVHLTDEYWERVVSSSFKCFSCLWGF